MNEFPLVPDKKTAIAMISVLVSMMLLVTVIPTVAVSSCAVFMSAILMVPFLSVSIACVSVPVGTVIVISECAGDYSSSYQ